jgi:hypothetical protein
MATPVRGEATMVDAAPQTLEPAPSTVALFRAACGGTEDGTGHTHGGHR